MQGGLPCQHAHSKSGWQLVAAPGDQVESVAATLLRHNRLHVCELLLVLDRYALFVQTSQVLLVGDARSVELQPVFHQPDGGVVGVLGESTLVVVEPTAVDHVADVIGR